MKPTGPLFEASGPHDYEGQGRSAYWDTPEKDRQGLVGRVLKSTAPFTPEPEVRWAKGWLSEHHRATRAVEIEEEVARRRETR